MKETLELIAWHAPGPYCVAFSTRHGGVSEGAFRSLNLGLLTDDDPARVRENRRLVCTVAGTDPDRATMAWQMHGTRVVEASPRGLASAPAVYERCDGFVTSAPGQGMLLLTADCLPIALCRSDGESRLAVLHAGWRGLLAGIARAGVDAVGRGPMAAVIGPSIGPCCYSVGAEVATAFEGRFGRGVVTDGRLDLWSSAERALREAGCERVDRLDRCTACESESFFSHRRDRGRTGRQGIVAYVEP